MLTHHLSLPLWQTNRLNLISGRVIWNGIRKLFAARPWTFNLLQQPCKPSVTYGETRAHCLTVSYTTRERMKLPYMADQCEQMLKISSEFVRLQVSHDEYLCMKVLLLLSTGQNAQPSSIITCATRAILIESLQKPLLRSNTVHGSLKDKTSHHSTFPAH